MADVDAQERVRLGIERQFVVSVHAHYELVDVSLALAEDEVTKSLKMMLLASSVSKLINEKFNLVKTISIDP